MNLTITVEDEILKRARMRALEENTSVNAVLRKYSGVVCRDDTAQAPCAGKPASPVTDHPGRTRRREMDPRRIA